VPVILGNSASVLKPAVSPMQLVITGGKTVGSSPVIASDSCAQLPVQQVCQVLQTNDWRKSQTNTANQVGILSLQQCRVITCKNIT